jgi:hypothetical protein
VRPLTTYGEFVTMCSGTDGGLWAMARRKAPKLPAGLDERSSGRHMDLLRMSFVAYHSPQPDTDPIVWLFIYAPAVKMVM